MSYVLGIDQSLNGTGLVLVKDFTSVTSKKIAHKVGGVEDNKLLSIYNRLCDFVSDKDTILAVMEGPSFSSVGRLYSLAMVAGVIRLYLAQQNIPVLVVPPRSMKKAIAGNGSAKKESVRKALSEIFTKVPSDLDISDALGLAYLGLLLAQEHDLTDTPRVAIKRSTLEFIASLKDSESLRQILQKNRMEQPVKDDN